MPNKDEDALLELLLLYSGLDIAIIIKFFLIFLYYVFNIYRIYSAVSSYIPDIGNLNFLSFYLDRCSWKFISFIEFFQINSFWFY